MRMIMAKFHRKQRRGMAVPEWFCVLAALGIATYVFWGFIGEWSSSEIGSTANQMVNPADLTQRFKGNNGVGNGEDGAPPGLPPENDGSGTSPGDPGLAGS